MSRHWTQTGTCTQKFKIEVNVDGLIEYLAEKIIDKYKAEEYTKEQNNEPN